MTLKPMTTSDLGGAKLDETSVLEMVAPQWRDPFRAFVRRGEASPEFLAYLEEDARAREAVAVVFEAQASAWEALARNLPTEAHRGTALSDEEQAEEAMSQEAESMIEGMASLEPSRRAGVVKRLRSSVASQPPARQREMFEVVSSIAGSISGLFSKSKT